MNCRPWVGKDVDRTDPWATPDLSTHIQIRVIDLYTLQDLGVYYSGHLGWSPAFRCCFVFLDVSEDYVARCVHLTGLIRSYYFVFSDVSEKYLHS